MRVTSGFLLAFVLMLAGCPSSGDGGGAGAGAPAAHFSDIYPLIFPADTKAKCNFCHAMPATDISNGSLHLGMDQATAYKALVGKKSASKKCGGMKLVVPGDADASLLVQKLEQNPPPCGSRMPLGAAQLTDDQVMMIREWIDDGAKDN